MTRHLHYILDGHEPVPADLETAARWFGTNRTVAKTQIRAGRDNWLAVLTLRWLGRRLPGVQVSTVFLGLDHSFGEGPPLLFETLVSGGALAGKMDRYTTWEEAEQGHARMVERVREVDE
jgi:hypothetical protein